MWNAMGNDGNSWQHSKEKKYSFEPINKNITRIPIRADSYWVKLSFDPRKDIFKMLGVHIFAVSLRKYKVQGGQGSSRPLSCTCQPI